MKLSEYEMVVKSVCNDQRRVITALGLPKICSELNISRTKWQSRNTVFYWIYLFIYFNLFNVNVLLFYNNIAILNTNILI